jgi:hypothetical protein
MMTSCKIIRLPLIGVAFLLLCSIGVNAQTKSDTTINKKDIQTLQRNMLIIQQQIHNLHIDGILRDKLDSVYQQSFFILTPRPEPKKDVKKH